MAISFTTVSGVQSVSNPLNKAYPAAVSAGDVLVAFVYIYNSTETCTGVSDSVNGAWTQAFGPINAANGTRIYGFYKLNSGAGTPTVTANFSSTNHHELAICAISGLSGGGAFDQEVHGANLSTNPSIGPTATLGAAVCAAIAGQTNSGVVPSAYGSGWTLNANLDYGWQKTSYIQQATASNAALTASWTQSNSYWNAGLMVFKDAGGGGTDATAPSATLTGTSSISAGSASGQGNATAPGATLAGTSSITAGSASGGGATGTFTFDPIENNTHSGVLNGVSVNWTWFAGLPGAIASITNGSGTITNSGMTISGLPAGAGCGIFRSSDGTVVGYQEGTVA